MLNPNSWRTLYLDTADFKPVTKIGEVVVSSPKRKGDCLGDSSGQSAMKRSRTGDLRSSRTSGGRTSATPAFDPSKHLPAPLMKGESAWPAPGQVSARVQTQPPHWIFTKLL